MRQENRYRICLLAFARSTARVFDRRYFYSVCWNVLRGRLFYQMSRDAEVRRPSVVRRLAGHPSQLPFRPRSSFYRGERWAQGDRREERSGATSFRRCGSASMFLCSTSVLIRVGTLYMYVRKQKRNRVRPTHLDFIGGDRWDAGASLLGRSLFLTPSAIRRPVSPIYPSTLHSNKISLKYHFRLTHLDHCVMIS